MNRIFREKLEDLMDEFPEYYFEIWGIFLKHPVYKEETTLCKDVPLKLEQI
mgnify:CR=1 FL=1